MNKPERDYLDYLAYTKGYSEHTVGSYQRDLDAFFAYLSEEGLAFDSLKRIDIRDYLSLELLRGQSARSCSRKLSALRGFYSFCRDHDYVTVNPMVLVSSPKKPIRYPTVLTLEQIDTLFSANAERDDEYRLRDQAILECLYASDRKSVV